MERTCIGTTIRHHSPFTRGPSGHWVLQAPSGTVVPLLPASPAFITDGIPFLLLEALGSFATHDCFFASFSFPKAAVYNEIKLNVWLRWINCIVAIMIVFFFSVVLKYTLLNIWNSFVFSKSCASSPIHSLKVHARQSQNQKVTKKRVSIFRIPCNEQKFLCLLRLNSSRTWVRDLPW